MKSCNNCAYSGKSGHEEPCDTCERVKGNPTNWQPEGIDENGLLPCPFCGSNIRIVVCDDEGNIHDDDYENDPWSGLGFRLYHDITDSLDYDCPIARHEGEGELGVWNYDTREEAIEAWNRRM